MGCGQSSQADYARALSVERMRLEPTNARLQARECGYLAEAALTSSKCSPEERDAILTAMWRHIDVVHVQRNACRALQNNAAKLEAGSECVVVEALTRAIRRHRHEPDVIEHALSALGNLRFVCDDITSYALGVVVKAMEYHGLNARVQDAGMQALSQTSQQDDLNVQAIAREPRILACIVTAIRSHPGAPNMLSCACLLLESIAAHPETTREALEDIAGLFKSLLAVMRAYPDTPKLQRHVCAAMVALSRRNEAAGVQFSALGDALGTIVATMNIHRAVEEVQAEACEAICRLASMDAAHSHDAMRRTRNLFDVVVAAMGDYVSSVQIQNNALSVLFLASYSPDDNADAAANREAIGKVPGVWWRIATAMRRHKRVTSVQEHAFAVLTYLALNNESNQLAIVSEPGAVLAISAALTRHPSCPELQARGCKALATLVTNPATWPALRGMPGLEAALRAAFAHDAELRTSVSSVRLKDFDAFLGLAARPPSVDQLITSEPADAKLEDTEPVSTSSMDSAVPGAVVVAGPHQPGSLDSGM